MEKQVYYPESDGEPMAESELHLREMVYVWEGLEDRFEADPDIFVGANMFLYYRKGDPERPPRARAIGTQATGVLFRVEEDRLRLTDAATGAPILRSEEKTKALREAEAKAVAETMARHQAEERAAVESTARQQAEERIRALEEKLAKLTPP